MKRAKYKAAPNLRGKTIEKFAAANIAPGAAIESDTFQSYRKPLQEKINIKKDLL
jgi:hypothetical protein